MPGAKHALRATAMAVVLNVLMAFSYGCTVKVLAGTASERLAPLGVMTWITFASSGASGAIEILTSTSVPVALTVGELSMNIPVAGVAVTALVPWKFWPRMIIVKVCPRLARIGLIESKFGVPTPMRKVFATGVVKGTVTVARNAWTARRPVVAPAWTVMGTVTCVPSGAVVGVPRTTLLSGGARAALVTSPSATPEIVSVPDVLGESGVAETLVATAPTATPSCGTSARLGGGGGGFAFCSTTPTDAAVIGPTETGGGGVPLCRTTPTDAAVTGVMVGPAVAVTVMVFPGVVADDDVPAGVVTVTARGPVAAFAAALRLTVICVPVGSTAGGLLMLMPSGGTTPTALAFWKLRPRTVSVTGGAPVCRKFGVTD